MWYFPLAAVLIGSERPVRHGGVGYNEGEPMKQKSSIRHTDSSAEAALAERMFTKLMKSSSMDKRRAKQFARLSRDLSNTFRHVCPNIKPKLRGTIIALLLDVFHCSDNIKKDVRKLTRLKRPRDTQALGSYLQDMQMLSLDQQRRFIAELSRNIPALVRSIKKREGMRSPRKGLIDELTDLVDSYQ
jgi:hypothetical protein